MTKLVLTTLITVFVLLASYGRRPLNSIMNASCAVLLMSLYLIYVGEALIASALFVLSNIFILVILSKCIIYFELEKEFQQIYRKALTSILGVFSFCVIFGVLINVLFMEGASEKELVHSFGQINEKTFYMATAALMLTVLSFLLSIFVLRKKDE